MNKIKNIAIEYENGMVRNLSKGAVAQLEDNYMIIEMKDFSDTDIISLSYSMFNILKQKGLSHVVKNF